MSVAIDRESRVPVYQQLAELLEQAIAAGDIRCGAKLPSESVLCRTYGMSRMTVRRAISVLIERGLVRPEHGRGVFVEPMGLPQAQFGLEGLREVFDSAGAAVQILESSAIIAKGRTAAELMLKSGGPAVHLRRLLTRHGNPIAYHNEFLVDDPELLEIEQSYAYMRSLLVGGSVESPYRSAIVELQVANLSEPEAQALGREPGEAAWLLEHTFYSALGRPLSWGFIMLPGDMLHFPTRIGLTFEAMAHGVNGDGEA
jgi:DNA-binding GntR family transcriptional regulator